MQKLLFVAGLALLVGACATQQQAAGTAVGAGAGALVGGPVGAVVGAGVGAVAAAPGGVVDQTEAATAPPRRVVRARRR